MGNHKVKVTGFRIKDTEILDKLTIIAKENCRDRNKEVEYALKKYVEDYEKGHGKINVQNLNINNTGTIGTINGDVTINRGDDKNV